jgi:hypothetical protein
MNACRINFALNCGSESLPPFVYIYRAGLIDQQLDAMAAYTLNENVQVRFHSIIKPSLAMLLPQVSMEKRSVTLPRMCQWFANDFTSDAFASSQ